MGLFGPPNIEKMKAKKNFTGLIKALCYKRDWLTRQTAAEALGEIGDHRAIEPLITALMDEEDNVRRTAAKALGEIGDHQATEPLIAALRDEEDNVRRTAAKALGEIGKPAVDHLIACLRIEDYSLREKTIDALCKINTPLAMEALIAVLNDKSYRERKVAAEVLKKLGWQPDQGEAGAIYWIIKEEWKKAAALGSRAVEPLIFALKEGSFYVREAAAKALGEIGDHRAIEPLITALKDEVEEMREAAAEALGALGDPRSVEPLIVTLKDKMNWEVRKAAAEALGEIGDHRAIEPLITALGDIEGIVRSYAAKALGKIGDHRAEEPLITVLKEGTYEVQKAAAEVLEKLGWQPNQEEAGAIYWIVKEEWEKAASLGSLAVEPLINALRYEEDNERKAIAEALGEIGKPAVEHLIAALRDKDDRVLEAAAKALGKIGDHRAIEPLITVLKEGTYKVQKAAAEVLEKLGWQPDQGEVGAIYWIIKEEWEKAAALGYLAIEPLLALLRNEDDNIKRSAAEKLDQMRWKPYKNEDGAWYWIAKAEWVEASAIGTPAIEPLLSQMKDSNKSFEIIRSLENFGGSKVADIFIAAVKQEDQQMRKDAALALISLYKSGNLDSSPKAKQKILELKDSLTGIKTHHQDNIHECGYQHTDKTFYTSFPL